MIDVIAVGRRKPQRRGCYQPSLNLTHAHAVIHQPCAAKLAPWPLPWPVCHWLSDPKQTRLPCYQFSAEPPGMAGAQFWCLHSRVGFKPGRRAGVGEQNKLFGSEDDLQRQSPVYPNDLDLWILTLLSAVTGFSGSYKGCRFTGQWSALMFEIRMDGKGNESWERQRQRERGEGHS